MFDVLQVKSLKRDMISATLGKLWTDYFGADLINDEAKREKLRSQILFLRLRAQKGLKGELAIKVRFPNGKLQTSWKATYSKEGVRAACWQLTDKYKFSWYQVQGIWEAMEEAVMGDE